MFFLIKKYEKKRQIIGFFQIVVPMFKGRMKFECLLVEGSLKTLKVCKIIF